MALKVAQRRWNGLGMSQLDMKRGKCCKYGKRRQGWENLIRSHIHDMSPGILRMPGLLLSRSKVFGMVRWKRYHPVQAVVN
jgi:hypothetical protein